jgi:hypothetical protein
MADEVAHLRFAEGFVSARQRDGRRAYHLASGDRHVAEPDALCSPCKKL